MLIGLRDAHHFESRELRSSQTKSTSQLRLESLTGGQDVMNGVMLALKSEPTPGYELAFVDDAAYRFANGMGTHMAWQRSGFGRNNNHIV